MSIKLLVCTIEDVLFMSRKLMLDLALELLYNVV